MLEIKYENFSLLVSPLVREIEGDGGPYLEWIKTDVFLQDGEFSAHVKWSVMPSDLRKFRDQLMQMHEQIFHSPASQCAASITGGWNEFSLVLETVNPTGGIMGSYTLHDAPDGPKLQGRFGLDQSFLVDLTRGVDSILEIPATPLGSL
jgi:hypothetical protein